MQHVGGNLCLDTRCFWYNQSEDWRRSIDWCHKADCGLEQIVELFRIKTHFVLHLSGDLAPNFMALGANVTLIGPKEKERCIE